MKKNLNVIQIKGIRGLLFAGFIIICLIAGFIGFPSIVMTKAWNFVATHYVSIPTIGIIQGVLLWGIIVASYFTFRKEKLIVCSSHSQGLNEEELKKVFENIKKQASEEQIVEVMKKAREAELKIRQMNEENPKDITTENSIEVTEITETKDELTSNR